MTEIVACDGLTKDYGQGRGVFDLDLEIEQGEILGLAVRTGPARPRRSGC